MSQLVSGETKYDLSLGFSWHAIINIRATGESRQKIIFELSGQDLEDQIFTIEMDKKDRLALSVSDLHGRRFKTPTILKSLFDGQFIWLAANIKPSADSLSLSLSVNGHSVTAEGKTTNFNGEVKAITSMGSAADGSNAATFKLAELVFINRVLNAEETQNLRDYFASKHQLGLV